MRCSMKILSAALVSMVVAGAVYAKPGSGKGPSGQPSGGHSNSTPLFKQGNGMQQQQQGQNVQQSQFKSQNKVSVDRHDRININHVDKSFKLSIDHCPSSYKKCDFGYCFTGKSCCHWEYKCWQPSYGCYFFYCPYTCCDYWFCLEDDCYYPVGFCPVAYRVKYKFAW